MTKQAIGILETKGLTCLVNGTDAMLKSANVTLAGPMRQIGSAMCNIVIQGDVAAVKAAIDAGAAAASQTGTVLSAHVIARPDAAIEDILPKVAKAAGRAKK
ncbi:BMC domain-containing protein [Verrucomicrobiaceae bacterium N1E253]|uniref:BMC domain-containing protein n=1 Tax=Oceaniferula marina TaxID=2748318 RepID=A0A851GMB9_9BACT|nr:BMC domain-containing protein [Oceaniferula marina]NWK56197.1 BMC domain-containing protein [Oceaniferula marina]